MPLKIAPNMDLAAFMKEYRFTAKITLEEAAAYLGLEKPQVVWEYENGARAIPLDDIYAMANLYNIPPDEVLAKFQSVLRGTSAAIPSLQRERGQA